MLASLIRLRQRTQCGRSIAVSMTSISDTLGMIFLMHAWSRSLPIPHLPQRTTRAGLGVAVASPLIPGAIICLD
jgi:hypothetical protein